MKKLFTLAIASLLLAGTAFAQDNTKKAPAKEAKTAQKEDPSCQSKGTAKSCCKQPSKTAAMRVKAGKKTTK
ncbi:hypothetical protein [Chitinophaga sp. sic0106]|uniref:hypothetical protein n=1 Tax=Chitinophaga sp. sic0106 TaxID=2854785 RepID=UPI001C445BE7|nr:hypothetical protein [Chitinophaga sp. sic0106]MBV7528617.1 hypothetical protein [Chitinophaga sp. sic0106]